MHVTVIEPPAPVVTAQEARDAQVFSASDSDAYIEMLLAVAQSQIDGWDGWLGRAIGVQTLEVSFPAGCTIDSAKLPLPPFIDTVSDMTSDDGTTRTIQYEAGYEDGAPVAIKHAIILMAGVLRDAVPSDEGALKSRTVDGVGSWTYSPPSAAVDAMHKAADALLAPYRVYRL